MVTSDYLKAVETCVSYCHSATCSQQSSKLILQLQFLSKMKKGSFLCWEREGFRKRPSKGKMKEYDV